MPQGKCENCGFVQFKQNYSTSEWSRKEERWCLECVQQKVKAGTPFQCRFCDQWKSRVAFGPNPERQWKYRRCMDCVEKRKCKKCKREFPRNHFTARQWREAYYNSNILGTCNACIEHSEPGSWRCTNCNTTKQKDTAFSIWLARCNEQEKTAKHNGHVKCNECVAQEDIVKKGQWRCIQCKCLGDKDTAFSIWLEKCTSKKKNGKAKCNKCMPEQKKTRGHWQCRACSQILPRDTGFAKWLSKRTTKNNDGRARCDQCIDKAAAEEQALKEKNMQHIQKKRRF